jgi:YNFM family putative membrane transporter
VAYYLGSSVFGSLSGHARTLDAWPAVAAVFLLTVSGLLTAWLRHIPPLHTAQR